MVQAGYQDVYILQGGLRGAHHILNIRHCLGRQHGLFEATAPLAWVESISMKVSPSTPAVVSNTWESVWINGWNFAFTFIRISTGVLAPFAS